MTAQKSLDADVYRIFDERPNACPPPKRCTSFGFDAALIQILRYPVCPVSVISQQIEDSCPRNCLRETLNLMCTLYPVATSTRSIRRAMIICLVPMSAFA